MVTVPPKSFEASRATSTPATRFVVVVTVRVPVLSVMLPAVALRSAESAHVAADRDVGGRRHVQRPDHRRVAQIDVVDVVQGVLPLTSMVTVPPKSFEASRATSTPATRFVVVVTVRVPVLSVMLPAVALRSAELR